ncbi:MAG: YHS domain-containing protein [Verrucomicrobia bacterium]|nr:YHS domain-containing protein [Verrucomicrobiota bacterium]
MKTTAILTLAAGLFAGVLLSTGCSKEAKAEAVCPVSGEKLGSMGEPFVFEYKGQKIKLCCDGCKKDFDKDPEKYLSKIAKPAAPAK